MHAHARRRAFEAGEVQTFLLDGDAKDATWQIVGSSRDLDACPAAPALEGRAFTPRNTSSGATFDTVRGISHTQSPHRLSGPSMSTSTSRAPPHRPFALLAV